jgi:O-antigen ligase
LKNKIFTTLVSISILSTCFSISISQASLVLSALLYLIIQRDKIKVNLNFAISISLFILIALSTVYNYLNGANPQLQSSELKDIFLFLGFIVCHGLLTEDESKIYKSLFYLSILIAVTGIISMLTPYRLSRFLSILLGKNASYIYSHHYGSLFGINLYYPIGLMNTHLSFGGIFLFVYPYVFFQFFNSFINKKKSIFYGLLFLCLSIVLILNNARSAIFGCAISIGFGILIFLIENHFNFKKYLSILLITMISVFLILYSFKDKNPTLSKIINPIFGESKQTDSGRIYIWNASFDMIKDHPFLGIGAGNYNYQTDIYRKNISIQNRETIYFNEVSQKGHAHNDFIHLSLIAGIFAVVIYILIFSRIVFLLSNTILSFEEKIPFFGLIGFFYAGLYQCYFQDDEVVILFWYIFGLLSSKFRTK